MAQSHSSSAPAPSRIDPCTLATGDLGGALLTLLRRLQTRPDSDLGALPHGIRGYEVLAAVVRCHQPSQAALAEHVGLDRTVMTYLLDDLERAGLIERRADPGDRRRRQVLATAAGEATVADLCRQVRAAEAAALNGLDEGERAQLRRLLARAVGDTGNSSS